MLTTPYPKQNAWRTGYCDALFGRPCDSPWAGMGFKAIRRNAEYLKGYMDGEASEIRFVFNESGNPKKERNNYE